jgi:hypothetical protein
MIRGSGTDRIARPGIASGLTCRGWVCAVALAARADGLRARNGCAAECHNDEGELRMAHFSRAVSTDRPKFRGVRGGFRAGRMRFAPALDALEARALLSTLVVTSTNNAGPGSLRQAITTAPSGSTILFANSLKGATITLTSGVLSINQNLNIDGPGAGRLAVSGGGTSQVFDVASGANVTIAGLTITGGVSTSGFGGGIVNSGNLTLAGTVVTDNESEGNGTRICIKPHSISVCALHGGVP